tara:strand:- start:372 stop:914 length:543 start_codon:yes stop_codon:yes gene_type:complete
MTSTLKVQNIAHTGGTNAQNIQSNGSVLLPSIPFGRFTITPASGPANPTVSDEDLAPLTLGSNSRGVTVSNNLWSVSQTGIYRWEGTIRVNNTSNYCWVAIYDSTNSRYHNASTINGGTFEAGRTPYKLDGPNASNFMTLSFSHIFQFVAGEDYGVKVGIASSTATLDYTQSEFTISLVG